jgi:hypothetical protein
VISQLASWVTGYVITACTDILVGNEYNKPRYLSEKGASWLIGLEIPMKTMRIQMYLDPWKQMKPRNNPRRVCE